MTGDRCESNPGGCNGREDCCTSENKCGEWEGDCDSNSDCQEGLICGDNNCPRKYGDNWDFDDDCCFKPDLEKKATCDGIRPVSCGGHNAPNCSACPQGHGASWCNGDCGWINDECINVKGNF